MKIGDLEINKPIPSNLEEAKSNVVLLKLERVKLKTKLTKMHLDHHNDKNNYSLQDLRATETLLENIDDLISIQNIEERWLKSEKTISSLRSQIEKLKKFNKVN